MNNIIKTIDVKNLQKPTQDFLCSTQANTYGIVFVQFAMRDVYSGIQLFRIRKTQQQLNKPFNEFSRTVKYHFGPFFFNLKSIGTTLVFKNIKPIKKFTIIEKFYFKNKLIRQFQFQIPFCPPNAQNSIQSIYELPQFTQQQQRQMIEYPYQTVSDSFYFVNDQLVIHNKAKYSYAENP